jgi:hypothetical protein
MTKNTPSTPAKPNRPQPVRFKDEVPKKRKSDD